MYKYYKFLVILCSAVLESCLLGDCEKLNLPKSDLDWFNCYKVGQKLYFKNQTDNIDTLFVNKNETNYSPCNKFELGSFERQEATIWLGNSPQNFPIQVTFTQWDKNSESQKHFCVFGYEYWSNNNFERRPIDTSLKFQNLKPQILKCTFFKNDSITDHCKLNSFFWNREYGLVKYILHDTLEYELMQIE